MAKTLMFRKAGTQFKETVLSDALRVPAVRRYQSWAQVDARLRELGIPLEKIENLKSDFDSGKDTVLIELP